MEENNIEKKFTGKCTEPNHLNSELLFFCKNHNVLCCEKCLPKEGNKVKGQHESCEICPIEKVKDEKEINFQKNIKELDNILKNCFHYLNEIIDKSNEEKEKLKLKIQKLFTKIRNEINKREDELFLEIDKLFEIYGKINYKENIQLFTKSKTSLETGKKLENEWNNDKKLVYLINNSIEIEKNIKDTNIILEKINKLKEENKREIDFYANIDINQFIQSLNKIGYLEIKDNSSEKHEEHPKLIDGQLMQISSGIYGVWGVNKYFKIYYRSGITETNKGGVNWIEVDGLLKHISSGESGVWGVNSQDEIFYRDGISINCPQGTKWIKIDGRLKQISSGEYGIYGVNSNDQIWFRSGISKSNPGGNKWISIDGLLKHISVGPYGVWGVNFQNEVWKRKNITRENPIGDWWKRIEGNFKLISSGEKYILGIKENNEIFYRKGISIFCNEGESWEKFKGELKYISDGAFGIWGINNDDYIYYY